MQDYLRFAQDLLWLRRPHPALRGESIQNHNRVIALQRWLQGAGRDVVVIASLNKSTLLHDRLGFPGRAVVGDVQHRRV